MHENKKLAAMDLATNFFGAYHVIRSFIPIMKKQGYGRIINGLVAEEIQGDIKINAVNPGWVSSDMGGTSAPRTPKQAARQFRLHNFASV